jgi:hypothetical protein
MQNLIFPTRPAVRSVFTRSGHVVAASGDYTATQITVTPAGTISSVDVQAALEELSGDISALGSPLVDWKNSCRLATTANITLSGEQTIDGSMTSATRVLVKNQTTASENGPYLSAAGAWTRTTDADGNSEVTAGMVVPVTEGTTNADTNWQLTTNDPITVGTTALTFAKFNSAVLSVFGRTGVVTATAGDYTASQITFTPSGTIAATNVQTAIAELDSELPERIDDRVAGLLVQGDNVTLTYNDPAGTLRIDVDIGEGLGMEDVEDALADDFVSGFNVIVEYDDAAGSFTWHAAERICLDADGATITFDLSDDHTVDNAGAFHPTEPITDDVTLAIENAGVGADNAPGKWFQIKLNYDDVGGHAITWWAGITWVNGYPPATTPVGGSSDSFWFIVTGFDEYTNPLTTGWILSTERGVMANGTALGGTSGAIDDLLAYWKFDEPSGAALDALGNYDLPVVNGSPDSSPGVVGTSRQLASLEKFDTYPFFPSVDFPRTSSDFTWFGWVKVGDVTIATDEAIWLFTGADSGVPLSTFSVQVKNISGTAAQFAAMLDGGSDHDEVAAATFGNLSIATFYFVAVRWNASTKRLRINVNAGASDEITAAGEYDDSAANEGRVVIQNAGSSPYTVDETGYVARELSDGELTTIYNSGDGTTTPIPTDIDWSICEGDVITLTDSGTHVINHIKPIPLKRLLVAITSDEADGTIVWMGVPVDWGLAGPPDMPDDGDTIYIEFECVTTSLILGRLWFAP